MTKYLQPGGFSVATPGTQEYRDNWDAIFGKKEEIGPLPKANCGSTGCVVCNPDRGPNPIECSDAKCNICRLIRDNQPDPTPLEAMKQFDGELYLHIDERQPLALGSVQRRIREWAEQNFPLKAKDEHRRMAQEFFNRKGFTGFFTIEYEEKMVGELAILLAARESRSHRMLLGACEELGELCHAHLKNEQGIRGTPEEWREKKKDAIGDTLIYLMDYCNKEDLDIEECLQMALDEIATRDWVRFPKNGKTE